MDDTYPTKRPTDATYLDSEEVEFPPELLNLPWVDIHNHAHTLSWEDRERYSLTGCRAMVMIASGNHWTPYKPVRADDVQYQWDDAINRRTTIARCHFFEPKLGIGIPTGVRIEDPEPLFDLMDQYCSLDEVAAIGEIGVRPTQQVSAWSVDEQRAVVESQMEIAARHELPVILHTPNKRKRSAGQYRSEIDIPGYELNTSLTQEPVLESANAELDAVKYDIEAADDAGLSQQRIIASHADPNNVPYLMENTDCYVSFTVGQPWLTGVSASTVAETISEYGPERVLIDTDCANVLKSDVFSLKRAIFELYRLGIDVDEIRQVVYDNPRGVVDLQQ